MILYDAYKKVQNNNLPDEMSIFQKYSKKGCIFECSVKFAIEQVGCLPWDFPVPFGWEEANLEICYSTSTDSVQFNSLGQINKVAMFYEAMNNNSNLRQCQCMPDCEVTIYDTQVSICCLMNL